MDRFLRNFSWLGPSIKNKIQNSPWQKALTTGSDCRNDPMSEHSKLNINQNNCYPLNRFKYKQKYISILAQIITVTLHMICTVNDTFGLMRTVSKQQLR